MRLGILAALLFVATVYAANWAIQTYGLVPVGFGLVAPAGVYFVGLAFTLRDAVSRRLGRMAVIACIVAGAALSWLIAPAFAVASGVAFLISEAADMAVYEPLRDRGWLPAVVASNLVGAALDSVIFLWLAFGSLAFFWGQFIGKGWMTLAAAAVLLGWQRTRPVPV